MKKEQIWAKVQLNEKEAKEFYNSKKWQNWNVEQIVKFQLFQRRLCIPFNKFHEAVEKVLKRSVWTHEFAFIEGLQKEYFGIKKAPTMEEIINLIPEDKRLMIKI